MGYITDEILREAHGWTEESARKLGIRKVIKVDGVVVLDTHPAPKRRKAKKAQREVEKLTADLVICAMRLANVRPDGAFDLWSAVLRRIDDKNGTTLAAGGGS